MKKTVFIFEWSDLPGFLKTQIAERERFQNDCYLQSFSEFEPYHYLKGMKAIEDYWTDQKLTNNYDGDLEEFIKEYHLEFDKWIIEQGFDMTGVELILIKICW